MKIAVIESNFDFKVSVKSFADNPLPNTLSTLFEFKVATSCTVKSTMLFMSVPTFTLLIPLFTVTSVMCKSIVLFI